MAVCVCIDHTWNDTQESVSSGSLCGRKRVVVGHAYTHGLNFIVRRARVCALADCLRGNGCILENGLSHGK